SPSVSRPERMSSRSLAATISARRGCRSCRTRASSLLWFPVPATGPDTSPSIIQSLCLQHSFPLRDVDPQFAAQHLADVVARHGLDGDEGYRDLVRREVLSAPGSQLGLVHPAVRPAVHRDYPRVRDL